ncbi:MAG TPA: iron ABC transporter permease [Fluviicola sp.]|nr:iron ABC transporter permease [Fluviicola sp.]
MNSKTTRLLIVLLLVLLASFITALCLGALMISPKQVVAILLDSIGIETGIPFEEVQAQVLLTLRLPRIVLALLVGAALAVSGVVLQGVFRNPLVDSGLIGIGSGASLFAAIYILAGSYVPVLLSGNPALTLAVVAFTGAGITTALVYRISRFQQAIHVTMLILAGVALNAICGALTGLMTYLASESELRDLTFWTLGSLGGANWGNNLILALFVVIPFIVLLRLSRSLDAFSLGEQSAYFLGVDTRRTKLIAFVCTTAMVGASVSFVGSIGFIGLVIPHILRAVIGPNHRNLILLSAIAGAILLCLSDLISRTILMPTEVPVGIITALFGTPVLLVIIIRQKKRLFA